uniref:Uncharacterized protein n=1 Tax=Ciona savignyi TaxID=51511 RepID=H2YVP3_CIOSA
MREVRTTWNSKVAGFEICTARLSIFFPTWRIFVPTSSAEQREKVRSFGESSYLPSQLLIVPIISWITVGHPQSLNVGKF